MVMSCPQMAAEIIKSEAILLCLLVILLVQASAVAVDLGTTLVAIKYHDGVVVGADSRTSVSAYVSHRYAQKIIPITDYCVICRSGSAADTQVIANAVRDYSSDRLHKYGTHLSTSQISSWLRQNIVNGNGGSISLLVAGYDTMNDSPQIYSIAPSGALLREAQFAVAGSGSPYILGHLDDFFAQRFKYYEKQRKIFDDGDDGSSLSLEEGDAIKLCERVVQMAVNRDGSSGGLIRLYVINRYGIREITVLPPSAATRTRSSSSSAATKDLPGFAMATTKESKDVASFKSSIIAESKQT